MSAAGLEFWAWVSGKLPTHRPSRSELWLCWYGVGRSEPVAVVGVPVK